MQYQPDAYEVLSWNWTKILMLLEKPHILQHMSDGTLFFTENTIGYGFINSQHLLKRDERWKESKGIVRSFHFLFDFMS